MSLDDLIRQGHRAFGQPQAWSHNRRGIGGEYLIADTLASQVNALQGGSVLACCLDLGRKGRRYPYLDHDRQPDVYGIGGDIDLALFVRVDLEESVRFGTSKRNLKQDHLVLIDSKQHAGDWNTSRQFDRAEEVLLWCRQTLAHPGLLGSGSDSTSLRLSYHFAHTGPWLPGDWLRQMGSGDLPRQPGFEWWNSEVDLVLTSPVEVLLGQLSVLLMTSNDEYRAWVPEAMWNLLHPEDRHPYTSSRLRGLIVSPARIR